MEIYNELSALVNTLETNYLEFNDFIKQANEILKKDSREKDTQYHILIPIFNESILSTGFIRELSIHYPRSFITLVVKDNNTYFDSGKFVDEIIKVHIDETNLLTIIKSIISTVRDKFPKQVDLAIIPNWPSNTVALFFCWLVNAKERMGYPEEVTNIYAEEKISKDKFMFDQLLTKPVMNPPELTNDILRRFYLLEELCGEVDNKSLEVDINKKEFKDKLICLDISNQFDNWKFSIKKYAQIILDKFSDVTIMIKSDDKNDKKYLLSLLTENIYMPINKKIKYIEYDIELMPNISLYLGNNTETMYIAAALNKPTIGLFAEAEDRSDNPGLSIYQRYSPEFLNEKLIRIIRPEYSIDNCSAVDFVGGCCYPYPHCINEITVEQIEEAIDEIYS